MEYSFNQQNTGNTEGSLASDRLRKAIERNRAKQSRRKARTKLESVEKPSILRKSSIRRTSVAKPETVEFEPAVRRRSQALTKVSYAPKTRRTKKKIKLSSKWEKLLVRGGWCVCALIFLRLIFTTGGILHYYQGVSNIEGKQQEYSRIINENKDLIGEINKIKSNNSYQKKLVRDHLGLIAKDEYLVVFP